MIVMFIVMGLCFMVLEREMESGKAKFREAMNAIDGKPVDSDDMKDITDSILHAEENEAVEMCGFVSYLLDDGVITNKEYTSFREFRSNLFLAKELAKLRDEMKKHTAEEIRQATRRRDIHISIQGNKKDSKEPLTTDK